MHHEALLFSSLTLVFNLHFKLLRREKSNAIPSISRFLLCVRINSNEQPTEYNNLASRFNTH
jgi:hypothetical protein